MNEQNKIEQLERELAECRERLSRALEREQGLAEGCGKLHKRLVAAEAVTEGDWE